MFQLLNKFAALAAHDALVFASGALKTLAVSLMKIANDIRWMGSGPRCGLSELLLPTNEPGSSIMPGKVNPTQCEALTMVTVQVIAYDLAITIAGSQGNFELNVFKPLIAYNILNSINLLTDSCQSFDKYLIKGIKINEKQIKRYVDQSLMLVTALSPIIGYDKAALTVHKAYQENLSLKEACLRLQFLSEDEFDLNVDPSKMIGPNLRASLEPVSQSMIRMLCCYKFTILPQKFFGILNNIAKNFCGNIVNFSTQIIRSDFVKQVLNECRKKYNEL